MQQPARPARWLRWTLLFLALTTVLAGLQAWNAYHTSEVVRTAEVAAGAATGKDELEREKLRQELIGKQIENNTKGAWSLSITTGLSAALAALGTVFGAFLTLRGYLDAREKERQDRLDAVGREIETQEKERQDRLRASLNDTLNRLVSTEPRQRVVGAAGLMPFLTADNADFHLQALSTLVAAARIEDKESVVRQGIRLAVERAVQVVAPAVLKAVSWEGVLLENIRLSGATLDGVDFTNAKLKGAQLDHATFKGANLTYADLAGANMAHALLSGANLTDTKVLNTDLTGADLRGVGPGWRGVPWSLSQNWRQALFDQEVRDELDRTYGAATPGLRVLMLLWEIPPMVAGGTWTACYHLVRNLRRRGADVTVVVPWARKDIITDPLPFGMEVPVVTLDIEVPIEAVSGSDWSPYRQAAVPAPYAPAYSGWSPYGGGGALWSGYAAPMFGPYGSRYSAYAGPYGNPYGSGYGPYGAGSLSGSMLYGLIGYFRQRLRDYVVSHPVDLIHAHDWVTFDTARAAAEHVGKPWIAHFHSTETDRQQGAADPLVVRIEQGAVDSATRIIAVSNKTRRTIIAAYDPSGRRQIDVVPNCLSESVVPISEMGRFETHRVIFLGRLSRQKGVDRFCQVAETVRRRGFIADFVAYGDGPDRSLLSQHGIEARGALGWDKRGTAFRGASALLVPSRSEPFGMVVLEGMQRRVPVIYPADSGAAEVLASGTKIADGDTNAMAAAVTSLLGNIGAWEGAVTDAEQEVARFAENHYEDLLMAAWAEASAKRPDQTGGRA